MPRYHLFGETVTTAEYYEANGVEEQVVVSESTRKLISPVFVLQRVDKKDKDGMSFTCFKVRFRSLRPRVCCFVDVCCVCVAISKQPLLTLSVRPSVRTGTGQEKGQF